MKKDDSLGGTTPNEFKISIKGVKKSNDMNSLSGMKTMKIMRIIKILVNRDKMDKILKVHDYLESLPEIGKVLSFGSI